MLLFPSKLSLHIYALIKFWFMPKNSASHLCNEGSLFVCLFCLFLIFHSSTTEPGDGTHGCFAPVPTFRPFSFSYPQHFWPCTKYHVSISHTIPLCYYLTTDQSHSIISNCFQLVTRDYFLQYCICVSFSLFQLICRILRGYFSYFGFSTI